MLQSDGLDVHLVNIVSSLDLASFRDHFGSSMGNPDGLENVHVCHVSDRVWNFHDSLADTIDKIKPDLMVGYGTIAAYVLARLDRPIPLVYCSVGFDQLGDYATKYRTSDLTGLRSVLQQSSATPLAPYPQERDVFAQADLVISHSDYMADFCRAFFPEHAGKLVSTPIWYFDWIADDARRYLHLAKDFRDRQYDVLFVASDWNRTEKNFDLVKQICAALPDKNIQIVGVCPESIDGVRQIGFVGDRSELFSLIGDSRVLVCPSTYDFAPGVLWEAAAMGCNVVASRNCGNWMLCPPSLLAEQMDVRSFKRAVERGCLNPLESNEAWFREQHGYDRLKATLLDYGASVRLFGTMRSPARRIAYHLWHYPILSETFIQREIAAVRRYGIPVLIVAESRDDTSPQCDEAVRNDAELVYLDEWNVGPRSDIFRAFFLRHPFRLCIWYAYTRLCRYHSDTSARFDRETFNRAIRLAAVLRDRHVVHVHAPWSDRNAFISQLAAAIVRIGFSAQARAHDIHRESYAVGLKAILKNARFLVTNTDYNMEHLKKRLPRRARQRLHKIYNGVDLGRLTPGSGASRKSGIKLVSVGRIVPQKGYRELLEACSILRERGHHFSLDIVGAPELERCADYFIEVTELRTRLRLEGTVQMHGAQPLSRVIEFYRNADLFVLPCVIDPDGSRDIIPNALIEAMAMELPVVSTALTGVPEIVDHGINGLLIETAHPAVLAEAIASLIDDPDERKRLGTNARLKVQQRFDIDRNARSYVHLFQTAAPVDGPDGGPTHTVAS